MAIIMSGKKNLVENGFKKTYDSKPGDRDSGYQTLGENLYGCLAFMLIGSGAPVDVGIVENAVLYYDNSNHELYLKAGGSWVKFTMES